MRTLIVDAKSGTSGAGRGAKVPNLFCEVNENMKAYGVASHRHTPEIEEQLGYASGENVTISFTPHLVPMNRGILATEYATLKKNVTGEEVKAIYDKYYADEKFVRAQVKAEGEAEALRDTYLFERATAKTLRRAYNDLGKPVEKLPERVYGNRVSRFFGEYLGVTLFVNPQDVAREKIQDREYRLRYMRRCEQGLSYPIRLSPLLQYEHKDREPALFTRKYPVTTLVLLFFLFSTIGWCWEVVLHLVTAGTFVNRGVLHGPWLPIYGTGGVLVLLALYKLRDRPWLEFIATIVVCGLVEYFTAYYLETVYDRRWWDYAGYFLNLHGRICAEGLLVFGLGGMAVVYGVAPLFDNLLHKVKRSALIALCVALVALFCVDQVYSHFYPNEGEGITDEVVYKVNDARVSPDGEAFV